MHRGLLRVVTTPPSPPLLVVGLVGLVFCCLLVGGSWLVVGWWIPELLLGVASPRLWRGSLRNFQRVVVGTLNVPAGVWGKAWPEGPSRETGCGDAAVSGFIRWDARKGDDVCQPMRGDGPVVRSEAGRSAGACRAISGSACHPSVCLSRVGTLWCASDHPSTQSSCRSNQGTEGGPSPRENTRGPPLYKIARRMLGLADVSEPGHLPRHLPACRDPIAPQRGIPG